MFRSFGSKLIRLFQKLNLAPCLLYTVENSLRNIVEVLITTMEDPKLTLVLGISFSTLS